MGNTISFFRFGIISPDGQKIIYGSSGTPCFELVSPDISSLDLATGEVINLTHDSETYDVNPAWSPDS